MQEVDHRTTAAAEYLAVAERRDVLRMPPSDLLRECAESRQLTALLAVIGEQTAQLGEIQDVLAAFDWEHDDRQLALERIERIAGES